jgi:ketosteroid isomerase-like protein
MERQVSGPRSPAEVAEAVYLAYGRAMRDGDLGDIAAHLAEDVTFHVAYPFERFRQDLRGRDAVLATLRFARNELADEIGFERVGTIVQGGRVLIQCEERGATGGVPYQSSLAFVFDVDGDLVTSLRIYLGWVDPSAVLRAIVPPEDALRGQVLEVERRLARAVLDQDRAAAAAVLDREFVAIGHAGNAVTADEYLAIHFAPERRFTRFLTEDQQVVAVAGAAIVTGKVTMTNANLAQNPPSARYVSVYAPGGQSAGWKLRVWQETPIDPKAVF